MRVYSCIILLITFAIGICYFVLLGRVLLPDTLMMVYRTPDLKALRDGMALPTRLALDYAWVIALLAVFFATVSVVLLDRYRGRVLQFTMLGLSSQCLLLWLTLFAYFYDGFEGPMCLHHDPEFDLGAFLGLGFGVFPVTLVGVLAAFFSALLMRRGDLPNPSLEPTPCAPSGSRKGFRVCHIFSRRGSALSR